MFSVRYKQKHIIFIQFRQNMLNKYESLLHGFSFTRQTLVIILAGENTGQGLYYPHHLPHSARYTSRFFILW
jgi:hypothetical protein